MLRRNSSYAQVDFAELICFSYLR